MAAEVKKEIALEIAHVLFIDIVAYSKMGTDDQRAAVEKLNQIVQSTDEFRKAESESRLLKIATGDGMALIFYHSPEDPVECALEISRAIKEQHSNLRLRMGVNSGPVSGVVDVNDRANVAGAGINLAQRLMDCGDAGHILLSKRVAEDLEQFKHWRPHLYDLGECEVKHGEKISVVNLFTAELGNREVPEKIKGAPVAAAVSAAKRSPIGAKHVLVAGVIITAVGLGLFLFRIVGISQWREAVRQNAVEEQGRPSGVSLPIPEKSIAVLPFENFSADKENAFFADGVQDDILTALSKVADLKVISRTSVLSYAAGTKRNLREIAQALGVAHILEGSVRRAGGKVRVTAQLIDARSDAHLWADTYDRDLADVFAIQSEIARTIAEQLQAKLSPSEKAAIEKPPTTDLTAYDLYLRAQVLFADTTDVVQAKEKLPKAARLLDEAVARDPQFLLAWCLLARVHDNMYWQGHDHTPARLDLANAAVQTALRLQPDAGEAHLALADYYYHGFRDYARAGTELAIARRTLPNNAEVFEYTGYIARREGHWEEATRNLEHALELDPRNFFTLQQLALTYQDQHRYADEARTYDRALTIVPGHPSTRINRAQVALDWRADTKPFQTMLATLIAEDPSVAPDVDDPNLALCERTAAAAARALTNYPRDGVGINGVSVPHAYWEGVVARWQGDSAKAQAAFTAARTEVEKTVQKQPDFAAALSLLGMIDAGLGRKEEALREGRRACELLPISKDAIDGAAFAANLAQTYAWTGEKNLAIEQIEAVERVPNYLSYGLLKLRPEWDSLRGDPRFEKIVASLAPKETTK
jgi:TolB-like protein/class 3 adenylate cyclase/Flp pilus assembly protein TadD